LGILTDIQAGAMSKMKVHPVMVMKTRESRFQVSGARCQDLAPTIGWRAQGTPSRFGRDTDGQIVPKGMWQCIENEGSESAGINRQC
jgi:hypothetical protein